MLGEYLKRLSDELEVHISKEEDKDVYHLQLNENIAITFTDTDPGVLFFSRIGVLHKDFREDIFIYLMRANLLGKGTFDAVIGVETDEKFLTLSRSIPYEIEYSTFKEALEVFANTLQMLREDVAKKYEEAKQSLL